MNQNKTKIDSVSRGTSSVYIVWEKSTSKQMLIKKERKHYKNIYIIIIYYINLNLYIFVLFSRRQNSERGGNEIKARPPLPPNIWSSPQQLQIWFSCKVSKTRSWNRPCVGSNVANQQNLTFFCILKPVSDDGWAWKLWSCCDQRELYYTAKLWYKHTKMPCLLHSSNISKLQ